MGMWRDSDRDPRFLRGCIEGGSVFRARHCRKVERERDITRLWIDAAPVEIGRIAEVLLDHAEYPVLVGSLGLFWFRESLFPRRRQSVKHESLSFEKRSFLHEDMGMLVHEFRHGQSILQRLG